ncbi:hypothetical protein KP79_PYT10507 [Mizuhopecten yessoensis]|uniref:Uncharacterized protein n=1 Tax=Mizuhopecten yessoensis TaxID=6573 RepID=A0A210QXA9_MIZYE|nr:hypothetical protein KP79_PYT10507 [Mizuhopecten yessoensis]
MSCMQSRKTCKTEVRRLAVAAERASCWTCSRHEEKNCKVPLPINHQRTSLLPTTSLQEYNERQQGLPVIFQQNNKVGIGFSARRIMGEGYQSFHLMIFRVSHGQGGTRI